jgi:hypothetical protein
MAGNKANCSSPSFARDTQDRNNTPNLSKCPCFEIITHVGELCLNLTYCLRIQVLYLNYASYQEHMQTNYCAFSLTIRYCQVY